MLDPYVHAHRVLGTTPLSTETEIREAYLDLVKVWHPDRFPGDEKLQAKAQDKLKAITAAYDQLKGGKAKRVGYGDATPNPGSAPSSRTEGAATQSASQERAQWRAILRWVLVLPAALTGALLIFNMVFFTLVMPVIKGTGDLPGWFKIFATAIGRLATGFMFVWLGSLVAPYAKKLTALVLLALMVGFQFVVTVPILTSGEIRYYLFIVAMIGGALWGAVRVWFRRRR